MNFYNLVFKISSPAEILQQIAEHPELWDKNNLRTTYPGSAHCQASDIWVRYNNINTPYLKEEMFNGRDVINYPAFNILTKLHKVLSKLMFMVEGERLGRVIITKLPPGGEITAHRDEGGTALYYDRFHIVLQGGGIFVSNEESVSMQTREVWWFDNQQVHSVLNDSDQDRIHLIVDIKLLECSPFWTFKKHSYAE